MNADATVKVMPGAGQALAISVGPGADRGPRVVPCPYHVPRYETASRAITGALLGDAAIPGAVPPAGSRRTEDDETVKGARSAGSRSCRPGRCGRRRARDGDRRPGQASCGVPGRHRQSCYGAGPASARCLLRCPGPAPRRHRARRDRRGAQPAGGDRPAAGHCARLPHVGGPVSLPQRPGLPAAGKHAVAVVVRDRYPGRRRRPVRQPDPPAGAGHQGGRQTDLPGMALGNGPPRAEGTGSLPGRLHRGMGPHQVYLRPGTRGQRRLGMVPDRPGFRQRHRCRVLPGRQRGQLGLRRRLPRARALPLRSRPLSSRSWTGPRITASPS